MSDVNYASPIQQDRLPIPGWEDRYEIDLDGNVYTLFPSNGRPVGSKMKHRLDRSGYVHVALSRNGYSKGYTVHRLLMLTWKPVENSANLDVNHIDGDKANNDLNNLEWLTHKENIRHAHTLSGPWKDYRGEQVVCSKLTTEIVKEIRRLKNTGLTQSEIAAIYGVTQENVSAIVLRKSWRHVE